MYFLVIGTDETLTCIPMPEVDKIYMTLKEHLNDGMLQAIDFGLRDLDIHGTMYFDDNGKLEDLPYNMLASKIFDASYSALRGYIVGPVVLTGPVDDEGYDTGLEDWQVQSIVIWLSQFDMEEASA